MNSIPTQATPTPVPSVSRRQLELLQLELAHYRYEHESLEVQNASLRAERDALKAALYVVVESCDRVGYAGLSALARDAICQAEQASQPARAAATPGGDQ